MRIGIVQFNPLFGAVARNIAKAISMVKGYEADLWVLPELFATGYQLRDREEAYALSEADDGPTIRTMLDKAAEFDCFFCGGFIERRGEHLCNSAFLAGPEGLVGIYRKLHLFNREKELFAPGTEGFTVRTIRGVAVGMMICFDWIFPESARTLALAGAQVILHPSNLVLAHCPDAMKTRALENRVFTVTANRIGTESRVQDESLTFVGQSVLYGPDGDELARAPVEDEVALVVEIDEHRALNKWVTERNDLVLDRRPSHYEL